MFWNLRHRWRWQFRVKSLKSDGNIVGHIQFDNCNAIHYANECSDVIKQGLSTFTGAEEEFIKGNYYYIKYELYQNQLSYIALGLCSCDKSSLGSAANSVTCLDTYRHDWIFFNFALQLSWLRGQNIPSGSLHAVSLVWTLYCKIVLLYKFCTAEVSMRYSSGLEKQISFH